MAAEDVVVTVTSDTSGFTAGMREAAGATVNAGNQINQTMGGVKEHVAEAAKELAKLTIGAIGIEKIFELGKRSLETAENVDRMSQSLGFSTTAIQTMGYAAALTGGGGLESMRGSLAKLERAAAEANSGNKTMLANFQALGISASQLATLMKNPDDMLKTVTERLAGFNGGANKVNLAMAMMGRGAAENIPLINKLGKEWAQLQKHAEDIGAVLSEKDVKALADVEDKFNDLEQQTQGLANQMMIGLLPALNDVADGFSDLLQSGVVKEGFGMLSTSIRNTMENVREFTTFTKSQVGILKSMWGDYWKDAQGGVQSFVKENFAGLSKIKLDFLTLVEVSADGWAKMYGGAQKAWIYIEQAAAKAYASLKNLAADFIEFQAKGLDSLINGFRGLAGDWLSQTHVVEDMVKGTVASLRDSAKAGVQPYEAALADIDAQTKKNIDNNHKYVESLRAQVKAMQDAKKEMDKGGGGREAPGIVDPSVKKAADEARDAYEKLVDIQNKFAAQSVGPVAKANAQLVMDLKAINEAAEKARELGYDRVKVEEAQLTATLAAHDAYNRKIELIEKENDITGKMLDNLKQERDAIGLSGQALFVYQTTLEAVNAAKQKNIELTPEQINQIQAEAAAVFQSKEAWAMYQQTAQETAEIWKSGLYGIGDETAKLLSGQEDSFKEFGHNVVNEVKQMIGNIISQYLRLSILNPILNSLFGGMFGGGSGMLATAGGALFSGGMTSDAFGGGAAGVMQTAGAVALGGGQQGQGNGWSSSIGQGYQAYQMYNKGFGGIGNTMSGLWYGSGQTLPGAQYLGSSVYGPGMGTSFAPSALGWGASIAGGVYAGYNRYQNSNGGAMGAAGGLAYGLGTTAVGLGVAGVATGAGFAAGVGALGALGPVGWAAIALMAVDMMSGGKLFGTKGKFNYAATQMSIGAEGATVTSGYDLKGQKAMFGGSTHSWVTTDTDPAAQAAADAFFNSLTKQLGQVGTKFGVKAGAVIEASFLQTFDSKGNLKVHASTVNGETFDEDAAAFQQRVAALSIAGTLDQLGIGVTEYINQFKANAADMANAVQDAMAMLESAKINIDNGITLLTGQDTLKEVWDYVQEMQQAGESLSQTYQQLAQAAQQYRSIMQGINGQLQALWAGTDPGRQFAVQIEQIGEQTKAVITQLNAAARAAGLQGAKEEDLARVHALAASQAAAAMQQLMNAGLGLVDQLYGTGTIQGQIDALQASAAHSSSALGGLNNAIASTAAAAQAAAQLMLGDLSILNDQQKLQYALQAYQKGQVDKDDVLEIGRRLYGTAQPYDDLFNSLQHMRGGINQNTGSGNSGGGMDAATASRIHALQDQQAQAQRAQQANQLASVVATMMDTQGKSAEEIADILHFKLQDLAKDLNMSQSELNDYLAKLEANNDAVPDSITSNIDRLIDVLKQLLDPNYQAAPVVEAIGHSGHGTREAIERNTASVETNTDAVNNAGNGGFRGYRN